MTVIIILSPRVHMYSFLPSFFPACGSKFFSISESCPPPLPRVLPRAWLSFAVVLLSMRFYIFKKVFRFAIKYLRIRLFYFIKLHIHVQYPRTTCVHKQRMRSLHAYTCHCDMYKSVTSLLEHISIQYLTNMSSLYRYSCNMHRKHDIITWAHAVRAAQHDITATRSV